MRTTAISCALYFLLPTTLAQWRQGWNRPPHPYGPPASVPTFWPPPGTVQPGTGPATVENGGPPASVQSGGQQPVQTGGQQPVQTGSQQPIQTGGQQPVQTGGQQPVQTGGQQPVQTGSAPSTQSTSTPSASNSTDNTPAKGVLYNSGNAQQALSLSPAWACDWDATPDVTGYKFEFVPQLWGPSHSMSTSDTAASDYVLFYNEPDNCQGTGGACLGVTDTIGDFTSKMKPFQTAGKKVSTPCVMNPSTSYMETFLQGFSKGAIDILCFHWYGDDLGGLQSTVQSFKSLQQTYQVKELWLSEMGVNSKPSDISQYTQYLDDAVNRYAYNLYFLGSGGTI